MSYLWKTEKSSLGVDWDTVKSKYDNILDKFIESYSKVKATACVNLIIAFYIKIHQTKTWSPFYMLKTSSQYF